MFPSKQTTGSTVRGDATAQHLGDVPPQSFSPPGRRAQGMFSYLPAEQIGCCRKEPCSAAHPNGQMKIQSENRSVDRTWSSGRGRENDPELRLGEAGVHQRFTAVPRTTERRADCGVGEPSGPSSTAEALANHLTFFFFL